MDRVLDIPFVSEAYDRLMTAQAAFVRPGMVEPVDTGERLRAARSEMGLTQVVFASLLGLDGPAVSKLENAGSVDSRTDLAVRYLLLEHRG